jgi:hypothetical protein
MNKTNQINPSRLSRPSHAQTTRTAEYHSRLRHARRFPVDEGEDRKSEELTANDDLEHHQESDGNTPKTCQTLDCKKDGPSKVQ